MLGQVGNLQTYLLLLKLSLVSRKPVSFKKFGGLYYAKDLDANGLDVTDAKFAIGPSTGRELIDNKRAAIDFDRGLYKIDL